MILFSILIATYRIKKKSGAAVSKLGCFFQIKALPVSLPKGNVFLKPEALAK